MSTLSQINMRYSALEDRILLSMKTSDLSEFRFWLTRHYVLGIWPALVKALQSNDLVRTHRHSQTKDDIISFQHESAVSESDFGTAYSPTVRETPLGDRPILLARFQVKLSADQRQVLCFHPSKGNGVEIALDDKMIHSLCELLSTTIARTNWGLRLSVAPQQTSVPTVN